MRLPAKILLTRGASSGNLKERGEAAAKAYRENIDPEISRNKSMNLSCSMHSSGFTENMTSRSLPPVETKAPSMKGGKKKVTTKKKFEAIQRRAEIPLPRDAKSAKRHSRTKTF